MRIINSYTQLQFRDSCVLRVFDVSQVTASNSGKSALDYAQQKGHDRIAALLLPCTRDASAGANDSLDG